MGYIHINIGSNDNRVLNIKLALKAIKIAFSNIVISSLYESPAANFKGNDFYNVGINATINKQAHQVRSILKNIEDYLNRQRGLKKNRTIAVDLDLVFFDELVDDTLKLPRADILKYAHVLAPLSELNANKIHPVEGRTYQKLWQEFQSTRSFVLNKYNIDKLYID